MSDIIGEIAGIIVAIIIVFAFAYTLWSWAPWASAAIVIFGLGTIAGIAHKVLT